MFPVIFDSSICHWKGSLSSSPRRVHYWRATYPAPSLTEVGFPGPDLELEPEDAANAEALNRWATPEVNLARTIGRRDELLPSARDST
jgi:hypothetical protein